MGEYADRAIAQEIRERGQEFARQHANMTPAERRTVDEAERKRQSEVWEAAYAAAQISKAELDEAGIVIALLKGKIEARRGAQVLGVWYPHKRGTVGKFGCAQMPAGEWTGKILKLARKTAPRTAK